MEEERRGEERRGEERRRRRRRRGEERREEGEGGRSKESKLEMQTAAIVNEGYLQFPQYSLQHKGLAGATVAVHIQ